MNKILSQNEIDALLKGMDEGKVETQPPQENTGAVPYDFTHPLRPIRGRMPTLDTVNDQFVRLLKNSFLTTLRRLVNVTAKGIQMTKFGDFTKTVPVPSSLHIFKMDPLRGLALLVLEAKVVFTLLDIFFGGSGKTKYKIEGRDFTAIESRFVTKLANLILSDFEKALQGVYPLKIQHVRSEVNPEYASIVPSGDSIVTILFEVEFEDFTGMITICIPFAMTKPINAAFYARFHSEAVEVDPKWVDRLFDRIKGAEVEVAVELGRRQIAIRDLLSLKAGDTLMLEKDASELLVTRVEGIPKFLGRAGVYGVNKALQIEGTYEAS